METNKQRMITWALTNLGTARWALKRYSDAIICYERAINQFETIQDPVHQAAARKNLGNVYLTLDQSIEALNLYLSAEQVFRRTQDRLRLAMVNTNKGMAYHNLQQWEKAKCAYLFSMELWYKIGNIKSFVNAMDGLGLIYFEQGLYDEAIATFQDALNRLAPLKLKNEPGVNHLFATVSTHLRKATEKRVC